MNKTLILCAVLLILGAFYIMWLDYGCPSPGGVITWEGKKCFNDL